MPLYDVTVLNSLVWTHFTSSQITLEVEHSTFICPPATSPSPPSLCKEGGVGVEDYPSYLAAQIPVFLSPSTTA